MSQHNEVGKIGEEFAKKYLKEKGYKIIEQNYKTKYAEIDLVVQNTLPTGRQEKCLIFVEVRTKVGESFGTLEETINKKKMRKLWGNAMAYASVKKWNGFSRVDAICIVLKPLGRSPLDRSPTGETDYSIERLSHYENIA